MPKRSLNSGSNDAKKIEQLNRAVDALVSRADGKPAKVESSIEPLVRVAAEKALPFEPLNPNAETVAAMKAARRGELVKVGKPDKLLRSLNAGD